MKLLDPTTSLRSSAEVNATTAIVAVAAALVSGFVGAWLGAWITTRHDRFEQLRTRRIEAADALVQEWADTLFAMDAAIQP
jgi:hypothetical protein